MVPSNRQEMNLPMKPYDLEILGTIGTKVILVGVDQSVYFQSKDNILSPETVGNVVYLIQCMSFFDY